MRPSPGSDVVRISRADSISALRCDSITREHHTDWTTRHKLTTSTKAKLDAKMQSRGLSQQTMSTSSIEQNEEGIKAPMTAPLFSTEPVTISPRPKSTPEMPSFVYKARPEPFARLNNAQTATQSTSDPTPAYSEAEVRNHSYSLGSPSSSYTPLNSPTSMSTCKITNQRESHACSCQCQRTKRQSRFARWKSTLKDLFHHEKENDSDLEYIETSHWAE